ncbi:MAG: Spy/CpxP family protein refolding chaperone [Beijerinckiaceae bacterium]
MKSRMPLVLGMVTAIGMVGAAGLGMAQTAAPPGPPPAAGVPSPPDASGGWGPGMGRWMGGEMGHRWNALSKEDRAAFLDARIAAIHAGLRLTPDQEKLWPNVETAVRDMAKTMTDFGDKARAGERPKDPVEGMQRMAQFTIARGEALKKVADAAAPLYAALTQEQKDRLPRLAHPGMRERMGMWMRHHGMNWGWGRDEDGPRGPRMGMGPMGPRGDWH